LDCNLPWIDSELSSMLWSFPNPLLFRLSQCDPHCILSYLCVVSRCVPLNFSDKRRYRNLLQNLKLLVRSIQRVLKGFVCIFELLCFFSKLNNLPVHGFNSNLELSLSDSALLPRLCDLVIQMTLLLHNYFLALEQ